MFLLPNMNRKEVEEPRARKRKFQFFLGNGAAVRGKKEVKPSQNDWLNGFGKHGRKKKKKKKLR